MEPKRDPQATLVDLLDRLLDKGLILNADIVIAVAGVPLIGISLRAALAGVETMLSYGLWQDWEARSTPQNLRFRGDPARYGAQGPAQEPRRPAPCLAAEGRRDGGC